MFGVARFGLVAVFGTLPWLVPRNRRRPWWREPLATTALALSIAIEVGASDLGDTAHALCGASIAAFIWVRASRRGSVVLGLRLAGLVAAGMPLVAAWLATPLDISGALAL